MVGLIQTFVIFLFLSGQRDIFFHAQFCLKLFDKINFDCQRILSKKTNKNNQNRFSQSFFLFLTSKFGVFHFSITKKILFKLVLSNSNSFFVLGRNLYDLTVLTFSMKNLETNCSPSCDMPYHQATILGVVWLLDFLDGRFEIIDYNLSSESRL